MQSIASESSSVPRRKMKPETRKLLTGLGFISPWIIGFLGFTLYPLLASLYYSFTDFSLFTKPNWDGLANYIHLFSDAKYYKTLGNTIFFSSWCTASIVWHWGLASLLK